MATLCRKNFRPREDCFRTGVLLPDGRIDAVARPKVSTFAFETMIALAGRGRAADYHYSQMN